VLGRFAASNRHCTGAAHPQRRWAATEPEPLRESGAPSTPPGARKTTPRAHRRSPDARGTRRQPLDAEAESPQTRRPMRVTIIVCLITWAAVGCGSKPVPMEPPLPVENGVAPPAVRLEPAEVSWPNRAPFRASARADESCPPGRRGDGCHAPSIALGWAFGCAVKRNGRVTCWGDNNGRQATPPSGTFRTVSAGNDHACGIDTENRIQCWGVNDYGQANAPEGRFRSVSAGCKHSCGLREDGTVTCWGWYQCFAEGRDFNRIRGPVRSPQGTFRSISVGCDHACGIQSDGYAVCWGNMSIPRERLSSLSTGCGGVCGLRDDGSLVCWQTPESPPSGPFLADSIAFGYAHRCAIRPDGSAACWGHNDYSEATPPPGTFVVVASGTWFSCGVSTAGELLCWGRNRVGEGRPPEGDFR
jgi:hypothetical protein